MNYTWMELLWLLFIYSFLGWVCETIVSTIKKKKFINRGFSNGPFCLVYGVAAVLIALTMDDLIDNPVFLFLGCGSLCTLIEWVTGKTLERMNQHKWWDYSKKRWNFDGYICLQYSLLWAVLGVISILYGNQLCLTIYHAIPRLIRTILLWAFLVVILLDIVASSAAVFHIQKQVPSVIRWNRKIAIYSYRFLLKIIRLVEHRMAKAYPAILEKTEKVGGKAGKFAEGCGFYKLFWLFVIGSFVGDLVETVFCRFSMGKWMVRSSLVWGDFSVVWGMALALATALLHKDMNKPDRYIFMIGTISGGVYEYVISVLSQLVFGQVFWDYTQIPFNLGGRINLLFCLFWGIAAVVWIKFLYPKLSGLIEKVPKLTGYILTWVMVVFMSVNILVSALALIRYDVRAGGPPAADGWEHVIDVHFDDELMQHRYPSSKPELNGIKPSTLE